MTNFLIQAPNGKSYNVSGDNAEGALAALQQHLGEAPAATPDAAPVLPAAGPAMAAAPAAPDAAPSEGAPVPIKIGATATGRAGAALNAPPVHPNLVLPNPATNGVDQAQQQAAQLGQQEQALTAVLKAMTAHAPRNEPLPAPPPVTSHAQQAEAQPNRDRPGPPVDQQTLFEMQNPVDFLSQQMSRHDQMLAAVLPPDPFANEPMTDTMKRRGQQVVTGLTGMASSTLRGLQQSSAIQAGLMQQDFAAEAPLWQKEVNGYAATLKAGVSPATGKPLTDSERADIQSRLTNATARLNIAAGAANEGWNSPQGDSGPYAAAGDAVDKATESLIGKPDPRDQSFSGQLAQGLGSMLGFAGTSMLAGGNPIAVATMGGLSNSDSGYQDAKQSSAGEGVAQKAAALNFLLGTTEAIPIEHAIHGIPEAVRGPIGKAFGDKLVSVLTTSGEEAAQEFIQQVGQNLGAAGLVPGMPGYDPNRKWDDQAWTNAAVGALLGGPFGLIGAAKGHPVPADNTDKTQPQAEAAPGAQQPPPDQAPPTEPPAPGNPVADQVKANIAQAAAKMAAEKATPSAPVEPQAPAPQTPPPVPPNPTPGSANSGATPVQPPANSGSTPAAGITQAQVDAAPDRYEVMDTLTGKGSDARADGGKVVYDKQTGQVAPLATPEAPAQAAGAPGGGDSAGQQPQGAALDLGPGAAPAAASPATVTPEAAKVAAAVPRSKIVTMTNADIPSIGTDAKTFQYKAGGDQNGVTDRLQGVKQWDVARAGMALVYEYKDGRRVVVDGHQRLGLAKRAVADGQNVEMPAILLRQTDGVTPEQARADAALKNIAEGTGTAVDAAKVLRDTKKTPAELNLPPSSALVRDANGLRHLGTDAFGMVANGISSERDGAIVGRLVKDPSLQVSILGLLKKSPPANAFQAEMMVQQAAAATTTETQDSLFGAQDLQKNLYLERAKILDAAVKHIRANAKAFANVIQNADTLAAAGNTLATDSNQQQLVKDRALGDYLASQANMKGPVSDALTQAARDLAAGKTLADAGRAFIRAVRDGNSAVGGQSGLRGQDGQKNEPLGGTAATPEASQPGSAKPVQAEGLTPTTEQTPAGTQSVIPGAEQNAQASAAARKPQQQAQIDAKAQQSKMGTTAPQDDGGPLFAPPEPDLFAAPAPKVKEKPRTPTGPELAQQGSDRLGQFPGAGTVYSNAEPVAKKDPAEHAALMADLAAKDGLEARIAIARSWVRKMGLKTGMEHMVIFDADGLPVSVTSGVKDSVGWPDAVSAMLDKGLISAAIHNHPRGTPFSPADIAYSQVFPRVEAVSQRNSDVHVANPGPHALKFTTDEAKRIGEIKDALHAIDFAANREVGQPHFDATQDSRMAQVVQRSAFALAMARIGIISYTGPAEEILSAHGVDFNAFYANNAAAFATLLRRAGFTIPEVGDTGGNRPGDGAKAADQTGSGSGAGAVDQSQQASGRSDGSGRISPTVAPATSGDADIDNALDALFGPGGPDVSSPSGPVEQHSGNAAPSDGVGTKDVSPASGPDGRGNQLGTGPGDAGNGQSDLGGGLPGDNAAPVGTEGNPGVGVRKRAARKPSAGGNSGGRSGSGKGGLSPEANGTGNAAQPSGAGAASPKLSASDALAAIRNALKEDVAHWAEGLAEDAARTDAPAFKKWFGNSKVVDEAGKPLVVYHGTPDVRGILSQGFSPSPSRGGVFFFSNDHAIANTYADDRRAFDYQNAEPHVVPVYLSLKNPAVIDAAGQKWRGTEAKIAEARASGHDGVIIKNSRDEYNNTGNGGRLSTVYAAFEPTQIKSAMSNSLRSRVDGTDIGGGPNQGTWDATNPNMFAEDTGIDPMRYQALEGLFINQLQDVPDAAAMSRAEVMQTIIKPLVDAGMTRAEIVKVAPYLQAFHQNLASGRVLLKPEEALTPKPTDAPEADRAAMQAKADRIKPVAADEANIRATLPLLLPEQQDDVLKIETRFAKPQGHGMMITNGTGTGKTYTGAGAVKRFVQMGKKNILIVAPNDAVLAGWKATLDNLGVSSAQLGGVKDAGQGVSLTTYANLQQNNALASRAWDLVVPDEAQNLGQNKAGESTGALDNLRAITNHPDGLHRKSDMIRAEQWAKAEAMPKGEAKNREYERLQALRRADVERFKTEPRGKVLMLSATPFARDLNVDYGQGYLFDYPGDGHVGHSRQSGRNIFMVQNFGYRIRYHKLTKPESAVDSGVFEREFYEKLVREGVLSGRALQIDVDYDRKFVVAHDAIGTKIDAVLQTIRDGEFNGTDKALKDGYSRISRHLAKAFDYLHRMQLLEAIKAKAAIPDIQKHLALGRKVVVFHDFNVGGGTNPFADMPVLDDANMLAAVADLTAKHPDLQKLDFSSYGAPVDVLSQAFGKRAALFNGTVPKAKRLGNLARFNTDGSGADVLIVQADAGGAGISMHDTTGNHQRVLINLGMPVKPTTTLQEEGRILRVGTKTNAAFRYYTIGTAWERQAFARKIAEASGSVENLALGNGARDLRNAFINAYVDAAPMEPSPSDGTGGKLLDRGTAKASAFDIAKTHYFGRMKTTGRRDQREGTDFYPTPEPLGLKMVEWAGIRQNEQVLEPSAGDGAIARYMPEGIALTMVEPSTDLATRANLRAPSARVENTTFENYHIVNKAHVVVMNPPFGHGGKTAYDHVQKAARHLRPGGRIVALVPTGPSADKHWERIMGDIGDGTAVSTIILPAVTFEKAGTAVNTRILIIDKAPLGPNGKVDVQALTDMHGRSSFVDLSNATSVNDLFNRIEHLTMPQRPAPAQDVVTELEQETQEVNAPAQVVLPSAPVGEGLTFKLAQVKHAKKGTDLFVATMNGRVERDAYTATLAVAKSHGGYYSAFKGNGAVPGFQFPTEAARKAFLDDMAKPTVGAGLEEEAWHGTPHDFEQFSLDHIGRGEGAQVYGWGLYFAGNRSVSEWYRRKLSRPYLEIEGSEVPSFMVGHFSGEIMAQMKDYLSRRPAEKPQEVSAEDWRAAQQLFPYSLRTVATNLRDKYRENPDGDVQARLATYRQTYLAQYNGAVERGENAQEQAAKIAAVDWMAARVTLANPGRLFKVEVPSPDTMLDWDKPVSEQAPNVRANLRTVGLVAPDPTHAWKRVADSQNNRAYWEDQNGYRIIDNGDWFSVLSPFGLNVARGDANSLAAAKKMVARDAANWGEMTGGEAYRLLTNQLAVKMSGRPDRNASLALRDAGIPGLRYLDGTSRNAGEGSHNYVVFDDQAVRVLEKFQRDQMVREARAATEEIARIMPKLRAELDRLDLGRVRLSHENGADWQGMFQVTGDGAMEIVIGASLDPQKTLYHEVIHALRTMNLFTPNEWLALRRAALKGWMDKHDIPIRYPDLTMEEQIEEAIAEEFSQALEAKKAPPSSLLIQAFNKIARIFRAIRNVFTHEGYQTPQAIFGDVLSGEISKRQAGNTGSRPAMAQMQGEKMQALPADLRLWRDGLARFLQGKINPASDLRVGRVPKVLRAIGVPSGSVVMRGSKVKLVTREHADLPIEALRDLPNLLENPDLIAQEVGKESDWLAVTSARAKDGRPVVVAIKSQGETNKGQSATVVLTVYPLDDAKKKIGAFANSERISYVRDDRSSSEFELTGANSLRGFRDRNLSATAAPKKILRSTDVFKADQGPGFSEDTQKYQRPMAVRPLTAQGRAAKNTGMLGSLFIPDRRVWEEITRAGTPIWDRLRNGAGGLHDAVDRARVKLQDAFLPFLRAQQAVMLATGQKINADHNAFLTHKTFSGKVAKHFFDIDHQFTKPIIDLIAKTKGSLTFDDVGEWLYARHAIERNARIASINQDMQDGGSGMETADAQAILAQAAAGPHAAALEKIGALVDQLREKTLQLRLEAGLITQAEADMWRTMYKHYVPLKGFADTDHSDAVLDVAGIGRRFNVRGGETKRAMGRGSEAFNPLQGAITQAQEVAIRAEKNRVGNAIYELAKDFPSKLLWSIKKPATKRYFNKTTGMVETRVEDPVSLIMDPNEMAVKIEGVEHRILFHDERLATAAGTVGADSMGSFMRVLSSAMMVWRAARTSLSPAFVIKNAVRDMIFGQINLHAIAGKDAGRIARGAIKNWPAALAGVYRGQAGHVDTQWSKFYDEFQRSGAKVSFWRMEDPAKAADDMAHRINLATGNVVWRAAKTMTSPRALFSNRDNPMLAFTERVNLAIENATRLAVYVEARRAGRSEQDAAVMARDVTLDFNNKGQWGSVLNTLYGFFNAGMQGTYTLANAMSSAKVRRISFALVAMGFMAGMMNANLSATDDDGVLAYDKIPDYQNQMSLQVMMGQDSGTAAALPMPYGFNIFPYMGQEAEKVHRGVKTPEEAMQSVAVAALQAFSPVNGGDFYSTVMPTLADPILDLARNKDWLLRPIKPDYSFDLKPESQKAYPGATNASRTIAQGLNAATGGTSGLSGAIDISPEYLDYMAAFVTGSAGSFWGSTADLAAKALTGDLSGLEVADVPIVKDYVHATPAWLDSDRYFRFRDEIQRAEYAVKTSAKTGEALPEAVQKWATLAAPLKEAEKRRKNGEDIFLKFNGLVTRTMGQIGE